MLQKNKKVLYFCLEHYDYLADSFLIGLKQQSNLIVYEYGSNKSIYKTNVVLEQEHGKGFTIGKIIDETSRVSYCQDIPLESIDLFVFSSILHQAKLAKKFSFYLNFKNTVILDGGDKTAIYPYYGGIIKKLDFNFLLFFHHHFLYFKREWDQENSFFLKLNTVLPSFIKKNIVLSRNIRKISFSIPKEKIIEFLPKKTKLFPKHIVDEDVAKNVIGSHTSYAFDREETYYADLQASKFGITTKRSGWDCMRHYEIAANGAVICFKDLDKKPETCAPHGLIDAFNCIIYRDFADLMFKLSKITEIEYNILQKNSLTWINLNTCSNKVLEILKYYSNV